MSARPETPAEFVKHLSIVTSAIAGRRLDPDLEVDLNRDFSVSGEWFAMAQALCRTGVADGWLCGREAAGIRFGRAIAANDGTNGYSVDVVEMQDVVGPHHSHHNGEIDLIMPLDETAEFDGRGAGWLVYGAGSAHSPTVAKGRALVLYLLPEGAIEFTR